MWTSSHKGEQFSEWSCSVLGSSCFQATEIKFLIHLMAPVPALTFLQIISAWQSQLSFSMPMNTVVLIVDGVSEPASKRFRAISSRKPRREQKGEERGRWREENKNFPLFPSSTTPPTSSFPFLYPCPPSPPSFFPLSLSLTFAQ